jgi:hypothetical protein
MELMAEGELTGISEQVFGTTDYHAKFCANRLLYRTASLLPHDRFGKVRAPAAN